MDRPGDRLDSWKAIAEYLGRDRTTVMRWERSAGLPVKRVAGGGGRSVFAYKAEIDRWLAEQGGAGEGATDLDPAGAAAPQRFAQPPLTILRASMPIIVLVMIALVVLIASRPAASPVRAAVIDHAVEAFDAEGRQLWRQALPRAMRDTSAQVEVFDVDGDGHSEVLAIMQVPGRHGGEGRGAVILFASNGTVRWERTLEASYRFGGAEYGPPWFPVDVVAYRTDAGTRVSVAAHHHTWWPSVVTTFDEHGKALADFVNAGWIHNLNLTPDGRYLLAVGVNNAFGGAALAVLDAKSPSGSLPAVHGKLPGCENCPSQAPVKYFIAPWTDLARPAETPFTGTVQVTKNSIDWRISQHSGPRAPEVIVSFSRQLEVVSRSVDDYFVETHERLEREGRVSTDPVWRRPRVRRWDSVAGWSEVE